MKSLKRLMTPILMPKFLTIVSTVILVTLTMNIVKAATPQVITYQALLTDSEGVPITDTINIIFTIWDSPSGGNALWTETRTSMEIIDGKLLVSLGEISPLSDEVFSDTSRYLGVQVGEDDEISPRSRFSSVAYSYRINTIDGSAGGNVTGEVHLIPDPAKADQILLSIENQNGQVVLTAKVTDLGTSTISMFDPVDSKDGFPTAVEKVQINNNGITLFDSTGTDTTLTLTSSGSIIGTGQIQLGQNASSASATTVFGVNNSANGDTSTISGGTANTTIGDYSTIGGGQNNSASGNYATTPGGYSNSAAGAFSFAAGNSASALHDGSFVWNDNSGEGISSTRANQFTVRASGGFRLYANQSDNDSDLLSGVLLSPGNSAWSSLSNRASKTDVREINLENLLEKLSAIPITRWKYIAEESQADHIGPMSQDFYEAFGLGDDDKRISTIDADGIALAAIQALYKQNQELKKEIESLKKQVEALNSK